MVTGVEEHEHDVISWLENLKRGALYLLLHPFFPFHHTSRFNLGCLLSRQSYCCSVDGCSQPVDGSHLNFATRAGNPSPRQGYAGLLINHANELLGRTNTATLTESATIQKLDQQETALLNFLRPDYIRRLIEIPVGRLRTIQLILCTIALTYYLVQDTKFVIRYLRTRRNNKAIA